MTDGLGSPSEHVASLTPRVWTLDHLSGPTNTMSHSITQINQLAACSPSLCWRRFSDVLTLSFLMANPHRSCGESTHFSLNNELKRRRYFLKSQRFQNPLPEWLTNLFLRVLVNLVAWDCITLCQTGSTSFRWPSFSWVFAVPRRLIEKASALPVGVSKEASVWLNSALWCLFLKVRHTMFYIYINSHSVIRNLYIHSLACVKSLFLLWTKI